MIDFELISIIKNQLDNVSQYMVFLMEMNHQTQNVLMIIHDLSLYLTLNDTGSMDY